jgi:putative addiction module component (TIGR02574 family)
VTQLLPMASTPLFKQILELPADQRLQLVEDIWDSLAQSEADVPVPDWHRQELDRRLADPREDATVSWNEVQQRLKPRR